MSSLRSSKSFSYREVPYSTDWSHGKFRDLKFWKRMRTWGTEYWGWKFSYMLKRLLEIVCKQGILMQILMLLCCAVTPMIRKYLLYKVLFFWCAPLLILESRLSQGGVKMRNRSWKRCFFRSGCSPRDEWLLQMQIEGIEWRHQKLLLCF